MKPFFNSILFLFLLSAPLCAQIDRVEPPYWWADMETSEVQILFYGENIAACDVSTEAEVLITGITKTENPKKTDIPGKFLTSIPPKKHNLCISFYDLCTAFA